MFVDTINSMFFIKNMYYDKLISLPTKYILDSNIVADLERFYYSPEKMNEETKKRLSDLVSFLRGKPVDFNYALAELSANYKDGGKIESYYKSADKAVKMLLKMSPSNLRGHTKYGKNKDRRLVFEKQFEFGLPSKIIKPTLPLLGQAFTPLAKLFYELKTNSNNKIKIFTEFVRFLDAELNGLPLYEVAFATYLLFTSEDECRYVQSLLKVNNRMEITKKIWNVSWDLTFLRYINTIAARLMSEEDLGNIRSNFILVTQDKALGKISSILKVDTSHTFGGKMTSNLIIDLKQINPQYQSKYQKIYDEVMSEGAFERRRSFLSQCDPEQHNDMIISKADGLLEQLNMK